MDIQIYKKKVERHWNNISYTIYFKTNPSTVQLQIRQSQDVMYKDLKRSWRDDRNGIFILFYSGFNF